LFEGYPAVASDRPAKREPTAAEAADFGFRYESKGCPFEIIDTFKSTYRTKGMPVPAGIRLTDDERAAILQVVTDIRFFDLPSRINEPDTSELNGGTYELAIHDGVAYHMVQWRITSGFISTDVGSRLLKLHHTILNLVHARPDVVRLQPLGCGCAGRR
jgi:hypothetical protein